MCQALSSLDRRRPTSAERRRWALRARGRCASMQANVTRWTLLAPATIQTGRGSVSVDESLSRLVAPVADDAHDAGLDEYDNMSDGPTRNTAAIMLSFLLSFLGISCAMIIGGLLWQRLTARRREELLLVHLHRARNPINLSTKPGVWDVCIRDALSVPKLSDYAWEQLRASTCPSDAAIRLAKLHTSHPTAPRAPCHLRH